LRCAWRATAVSEEDFTNLGRFMDSGGPLLPVLFGVALLMWAMILERGLYFLTGHRKQVRMARERWALREDKHSWAALQVRTLLISEAHLKLDTVFSVIRSLVAICPLLGLLGTVTGMIEVFDVMALTGNGNPRAMAAGVSKATLPTMVGLVVALSGLLVGGQLSRLAQRERAKLEASLGD